MNFHLTTQKFQNFASMGYFCPKYLRSELEKYGGVTFHNTEQWCKIWINPDLVVSKMAWVIGWTFIKALKNLKNCTLMGSFCPKDIIFQIEKRDYVSWHWMVMQNLKENRPVACTMTTNLVNFRARRQKCEHLHFDWIILPKAYKI